MGGTFAARCVRMCAALSSITLGVACGSGTISSDSGPFAGAGGKLPGFGGSAHSGGTAKGGSGSSAGASGHAGNGGSSGGASGNAGGSGAAGSGDAGGGGTGGTGGSASGGAGSASGGAGSASGGSASGGGAGSPGSGGAPGVPVASVPVHLVPNQGVSGRVRVNFAVPLRAGMSSDLAAVRVVAGGVELSSVRRGLATHPDGSWRSVQIQVDLDVAGESDLEVRFGEASSAPALTVAPVSDTLLAANGEQGPRVWAVLPASWLSGSGVAGVLVPEADVAAEPSAIWSSLCDVDEFDVESFLSLQSDGAVWLYDRGTALYRGYARRGTLGPLRSAYIETSIYRNRITGTGTATRNGVPGKANDLKYAYTQNLALHYLLSGDDRFRESAEELALGVTSLWNDPSYDGSDGFWTERNAGFGLLAYLWAGIVSDDRAAQFRTLADRAVDAALADQDSYPSGYQSSDARCFAHTVAAHGESTDHNFFGCSPWMSAILADGLEEYARHTDAARAARVRSALVKLGTIVARRGLIPGGPPYYFMGVDSSYNMVNPDDGEVASTSGDWWDYEHVGEAAYLVAMAWHYGGRTDATLRATADSLVAMLAADGGAPHMRSFNWQCRSAVAAPAFLK